VGAVAGAHGVRGAVRLKSFTANPRDVGAYGPVEDEGGTRRWTVKVEGENKGLVIARLEGVADRDAAEALKGTRLYVSRDRLPETEEDEFFYGDLVGLRAETPEGEVIGRIKAVFDFGAGEVLDIERKGEASLMVPFTKAVVPVVDVSGGRVVVDPPEYTEAKEDGEGDGEE
jgi:16S rRNA processing protein RimM